MTRSAVLALAVGLALICWLIASNDVRGILAILSIAGWGVLLVVLLHLPQTFLSGLAWSAASQRVTLSGGALFQLRFVREAINALLPVAQVGGDVVRVRLAERLGVPLVTAAATGVIDLTAEMTAQALFTLAGVAALGATQASDSTGLTAAGGLTLLVALFLAAQRFGLFRLVERAATRAAARRGHVGDLDGLHDAVLAGYRDPRRLATCGALHLLSWFAGVIETWIALRVLGVPATWRAALAIESLGQAVRAAGFLIPGALGVQEGGYVLICGLFGIAPDQALALSLLRRIRELMLGLPGLAWWRHMERISA